MGESRKTQRWWILIGLMVGLNSALLVWSVVKQFYALSGIESHINQTQNSMGKTMASWSTDLAESNRAVDRLANYLHSEMTPEVQAHTAFLANLDQRLQDEAKLPKTEAEATAQRAQVDQAYSALPVWVQDEWLPTATRIQWALCTLADIYRYQTLTTDNADSAELRLQTERNSMPDDASAPTLRLLDERLTAISAAEKTFALDAARSISDASTDQDISAAYTELSRFSDDSSNSSLLASLQQRKAMKLVGQQRDALAGRMRVAETCADAQLQETYLNEVYQAAAAAKLDMLSNSDSKLVQAATCFDPILLECLQKSQAVTTRQLETQERKEAEARKKYQELAVGQIEQFWKYEKGAANTNITATLDKFSADSKDGTATEFTWPVVDDIPECSGYFNRMTGIALTNPISPATQKQIVDSDNIRAWPNWQHVADLAYIIHDAAAKKYLLPIDEKYLDPPVAALYDEAMTAARNELTSDDKVSFAMQCAFVDKERPDQLDEVHK